VAKVQTKYHRITTCKAWTDADCFEWVDKIYENTVKIHGVKQGKGVANPA